MAATQADEIAALGYFKTHDLGHHAWVCSTCYQLFWFYWGSCVSKASMHREKCGWEWEGSE